MRGSPCPKLDPPGRCRRRRTPSTRREARWNSIAWPAWIPHPAGPSRAGWCGSPTSAGTRRTARGTCSTPSPRPRTRETISDRCLWSRTLGRRCAATRSWLSFRRSGRRPRIAPAARSSLLGTAGRGASRCPCPRCGQAPKRRTPRG
eukprot:3127289-Pyramimonas_sp.AAC.2